MSISIIRDDIVRADSVDGILLLLGIHTVLVLGGLLAVFYRLVLGFSQRRAYCGGQYVIAFYYITFSL